MERPDDFATRRAPLAGLGDDELRDRFWRLAGAVVRPLVELAERHTSPSIERSVLLRMGLDSLTAGAVVDQCAKHGLLGRGAGHCLLRLMRQRGLGAEAAAAELGAGRGWDYLGDSFHEYPGPLAVPVPAATGGSQAPGPHPYPQQQPQQQGAATPATTAEISSELSVGPTEPDAKPRVPSMLDPERKMDVEVILRDLASYRPRRRGWRWRQAPADGKLELGPFTYRECSAPVARGVPLPAARYFGGIDPQPDMVITSEIASGRFEDDLRRMRMAAWHGADHIMVIRTAGQSHFDGLIEGTPEGVGGVPITRKQLRATRKALDLIEDEVGRPINFHSYVSGVAGPEIAVLFAEEGVNGAHQDPQYNVLYRNVNVLRSFVDAAVAKVLMGWAGMLQIDGAHNANATAREAWKVMPELLVQHAINCAFSRAVGMDSGQIALSTVPPTAPPAPAVRMDLPYAVALRRLFAGFRFRAQQNTRYIESDAREATVTHVLNLLITRLTSADVQSTITPDEGRNVPWHYNSVAAVDTAKQALAGMDGLREMVALRTEGELGARAREITERAVLFLEEIVATGGYAQAVEAGFFVDSGNYPERRGDGIARSAGGGVGAGTIVPRDGDYLAPVCAHFGFNRLPVGVDRPCDLIGGCTLCDPSRIVYVDELDPEDNVARRLEQSRPWRGERAAVRPEVQWAGDGTVLLTLFLPVAENVAEAAALEIARRLGLEDAQVVHKLVAHPAEGTLCEIRGQLALDIDPAALVIPERPEPQSEDELREAVRRRPITVVAATVGEDEHSVGMREIIDIKHGGLEKFGIRCHYLGTSVPVSKAIDAALELDADAILISTIISHADSHRHSMRRLADLARERGVRDRFLLVGGGTQVTHDDAVVCGLDAGFGRGTKGSDVASFLVRRLGARQGTRQES
ncbi:MAG: D-ornithine 4,5-aminomutase subunit OraE [Bacillota bacterium]|nr:D-ornithine 4,5-aminomutase subunit OraE [Bacillota bacterium]